ncbi:MAG: DegT/DnrJ/EryC1/StrS family aminotransferase, partial [Oscillospiraceae bacterium]
AVIVHTGAKLVLCDTAKNSFEIDYSALHGCITSRTKAIIGVDIGGVICDYNSLVEIAQQHKDKFHSSNEWLSAIGRIAIIADAAHSLGAIKGDKNSGQLADFSCFSFHAVKNLTTAEGGAVTWKNIIWAGTMKLYIRRLCYLACMVKIKMPWQKQNKQHGNMM